ncbi:MAG: YslB family protein [Bacillus sp. (in: firmicutes)]
MQNESQIQQEQNSASEQDTVSIFSKELLRDILLPDLLGKDHSQILYWAGKQLARKFPLNSYQEIDEFFNNAGWGQLVEEKQTKNEAEFTLEGTVISRRFDLNSDCEFQLEAGFLAQQIQFLKKRITEASVDTKPRAKKVKFLVRWDSKDSTDDLLE